MAAKVTIDAKTIQSVTLYSWLPWFLRLDVWPFVSFYLAWAGFLVPRLDRTGSFVALMLIIVVHILTELFTYWSINFKALALCARVKEIRKAEVVKVVPKKFSGHTEIVPLRWKRLGGYGGEEEISFQYRKQRFIYSRSEAIFRKLDFPTKWTFKEYLRTQGHETEAKAKAAFDKWGRNAFEFPAPNFLSLYKEQCMEPFFVFQVFCVALWCMDEYWYYSIFTLFMLLLFEGTVVSSRLRTLQELRRVRVDSQGLMVFRAHRWVRLQGDQLVPGDLVSIGRPTGPGAEERTVPGDLLLLAGTAIANEALLTGESTPQWKTPILDEDPKQQLSIRRDKVHVLFGGTKILQHTGDKSAPVRTPDGGCLAVVLRTGFDTSQGKLMRTILFSQERVSANNWESGLFILFLVFFALAAAYYVLIKGLEDPNRSRYKLLLNCSLIITSVIPPELPMELSIAVNTSLIALARRGIFCTEPFRIPFGGKVDVCCFDKTGTLTSDDMEFLGVTGLDGNRGTGEANGGPSGSCSGELISDPEALPELSVFALAACHSLVFVDGKQVGDPLEQAALKGVGWSYTQDERALAKTGKGPQRGAQIVHRFHFASHLKRMSVLAKLLEVPRELAEGYFVLVKGAPETIQERLAHVPAGYEAAYKRFTRQGSRVLTLAYKHLPDMPVGDLRSLERNAAESDLTFAGFAVFACPLRDDSADALLSLKNSSHELVMITGDQALTACHVAAQVHIVDRPVLILTERKTGGWEWLSPDEATAVKYEKEGVEDISYEYDLCVAGKGIEMLQQTGALPSVIPRTQVFARVAPEQKELILTTLKEAGRTALMCGDGTNDVGALKQAHVGVALLNAPMPKKKEKKEEPARAESGALAGPSDGSEKKSRRKEIVPSTGPDAPGKELSPNAARLKARQDKLAKQQQHLQDQLAKLKEEGEPQMVRLGDASMAAAFTAKHASVMPTTDIVRQGRCTLVTTLQMFKILGLNCLATAYVLSVMYLDGVKLGDVQATIGGMFSAAFFMFLSNAKPLETLSRERPHPNIFSLYVILSLLGQFAIHITFLITAVRGATSYMPEQCIEPDSSFSPNLVNTVSYMVNMMIQVATFAVNYVGHPFNASITENKPFYYALVSAGVFFWVLTSDTIRPLNNYMELVPLPRDFGNKLLLMSALDFALAYYLERVLRKLLPAKIPNSHKGRSSKADQDLLDAKKVN